MNQQLSSLADDHNISDLRIVFTHPSGRKQLRIFCQNPQLVTESFQYYIGGGNSRELEFLCQDLQYSDSLPNKLP